MNRRTDPDCRDLGEQLSRHVARLRTHEVGCETRRPRFVERDVYRFGGVVHTRLRILMRTNGCSVPSCTMCPLPNAAYDSRVSPLSGEDYAEQVRWALECNPGCSMVCLYNDGSFFADREIDRQTRLTLVQIVREAGCRVLMVESLPAFVTPPRLEETNRALGGTDLVIGIGLQSSSEHVRRLCIRSPVKEPDFVRCLAAMHEAGVGAKVYLLLKPPFLTEDEAVEDCRRSIRWLAPLHVGDVTLCPARVAHGIVMEDLHQRGLYVPAALSSVAACVADHNAPERARLRLSLFNVESSDYEAVVPESCDRCKDRLQEHLERFNRTGGVVPYGEIRCARCEASVRASESSRFFQLPIPERVALYLGESRGVSASDRYVRIESRSA